MSWNGRCRFSNIPTHSSIFARGMRPSRVFDAQNARSDEASFSTRAITRAYASQDGG